MSIEKRDDELAHKALKRNIPNADSASCSYKGLVYSLADSQTHTRPGYYSCRVLFKNDPTTINLSFEMSDDDDEGGNFIIHASKSTTGSGLSTEEFLSAFRKKYGKEKNLYTSGPCTGDGVIKKRCNYTMVYGDLRVRTKKSEPWRVAHHASKKDGLLNINGKSTRTWGWDGTGFVAEYDGGTINISIHDPAYFDGFNEYNKSRVDDQNKARSRNAIN